MTPKAKAEELIGRFNYESKHFLMLDAKKCALIAVDEIIKECYKWAGGDNGEWDNKRFEYWEEVKQEIKKL